MGKFAYHLGSHCCNIDKDKENKPIAFASGSCKDNDLIECPADVKVFAIVRFDVGGQPMIH